MRRFALLFLATLAALSVVAGCAAAPAARSPAPAPTLDDGRAVALFDGRSGRRLAWEELLERAAAADVVVVGETHSLAPGLAFAQALYEDLLTRSRPALSLEFFSRDHQVAVDDYRTGVIDEAAFRKATGRTEGNYPFGHRNMLESARRAGAAVVAANAPRRYARLARTQGFEALRALRPSQRALFVVPEALTPGPYEEAFRETMQAMAAQGQAGHSDGEDVVAGFYRAQNLWDATMADSIVRQLAHGPVLHVVGRFHSDFGGGLVRRLRAQAPRGTTLLTISVLDESAPELAPKDVARADVVVHAQSARR